MKHRFSHYVCGLVLLATGCACLLVGCMRYSLCSQRPEVPRAQTYGMTETERLLDGFKVADIRLDDATAADAVAVLRAETVTLPVSYVLILDAKEDTKATFFATNMTAREVLEEICRAWKLHWRVSDSVIILDQGMIGVRP